jgi:hypothetical protein
MISTQVVEKSLTCKANFPTEEDCRSVAPLMSCFLAEATLGSINAHNKYLEEGKLEE